MEQQIKLYGLTDLTLGIYASHLTQTYSLIQATGAEALHITEQAAAFGKSLELLNSIVKRSTAYVSTKKLNEADKTRDHALGVIINIIVAHKTSVIATKQQAALALDAIIAPYKGIANHEKGAETREVAGLISVLSTEVANAHLTTLHLTEELEALILANTEFEVLMSVKLTEEVERTPQTDIDTAELRKQLDAQYAEIVKVVNAYAIVQPTDDINSFITQMNALITLTKRSAASVGKDSKEPDPTNPDTPATPDTPAEPETPDTPTEPATPEAEA